VDAQPSVATASGTPGVSVSFLRFVDGGPPSTSTFRATIMPTTNRTLFGPRPSFVGPMNITVTNSVTGGPAAVFQYTNTSRYPTYVDVQSLECATGSTWKTVPLPTEAQNMVLVPSNSAVTQTIPVTATNAAWRISAFCIEQAQGFARVVERTKEMGEEAVTGLKTEHFSGRKYLIKSKPPSAR
jgi:hypothetical protein